MESECRLCGKKSELQNSHVVPAFVFRWLRETSGNSHMRSNRNPNVRLQDGPKEHWLCSACEMIFNRSETAFANQIFYPYLQSTTQRLRYGPWMLHFCASLSWRTLQYHYCTQPEEFKSYPKHLIERMQVAESTWRKYLLGEIANPGEFRQHLVPLDRIEKTSGRLSPNINRYLMRAIQMDICCGDETLFAFTKIGRFMILGFINEPNPGNWGGSRINANQGTVEPKNYSMPMGFWKYINDKADGISATSHMMSSRQHEKINQSFLSNVDRMAGSDFFNAMAADVAMFGSQAFHENQRPKKSDA